MKKFGGDGYINFFDRGNGFMGINLCEKLKQVKYVQFTAYHLITKKLWQDKKRAYISSHWLICDN